MDKNYQNQSKWLSQNLNPELSDYKAVLFYKSYLYI